MNQQTNEETDGRTGRLILRRSVGWDEGTQKKHGRSLARSLPPTLIRALRDPRMELDDRPTGIGEERAEGAKTVSRCLFPRDTIMC